ncbi:MAG: penicillin-binding protein 2 [Sphingomonadales bacterium]
MTPRTVVRLEGERKAAMARARQRLTLGIFLVTFSFAALLVRLVDLTVLEGIDRETRLTLAAPEASPPRADITDRHGVVLATSVPAVSLGARPGRVRDLDGTAARIVAILPDLELDYVRERLGARRAYVRIKRHITPRQQYLLNAIGEPGLEFEPEYRRLYPNGRLAAHAVGFVDADGNGKLGVEHFRDASLKAMVHDGKSLRLTIDSRVQHALEDELARAITRFKAVGGAGVVLDVHSGATLALASLPDFDPGAVSASDPRYQFNRATFGVYELGSVFKLFTVANALEAGVADLSSRYDATKPIRVAGYTINDTHPEARWLSLPELLIHSSNIATAKLALDIGGDRQRRFLGSLGLLEPAALEISELGFPRFAMRWGDVQTMTVSYGHGLAVSPLHLAQAAASILNGGTLIRATMIDDARAHDSGHRPRVVSEDTSRTMRQLMRLVVTDGTGRNADVPGYRLGGKTGTAEKAVASGYNRRANITSFLGAFPMDAPRYVVLAVLDEPQGIDETHGFATAGWNAAPIVRNVVLRVAPMLGIEPGPWDVELKQARRVMQASYTP